MSVLSTGLAKTSAGGYDIDNSLRFNDDDSANLTWLQGTSNRRTWTWSGWVKRGNLTNEQPIITWQNTSENSDWDTLEFSTTDTIRYYMSGASSAFFVTNQVFRDTSAWYHICLAVDTTQATASNRVKLYVNGEQVTSFSTATYPSQNYDTWTNLSGRYAALGSNIYADTTFTKYLDGYLAEVNFVDGQALTPADFGETGDYGEWKPIEYTGTYGTNGFYLDFKDSGSLGNDANGSNNWTPNNLAATDQMLDSPTNNFCTLNPLNIGGGSLSEGNLTWGISSSTGLLCMSSVAFDVGSTTHKYYWEVVLNSGSCTIGIAPPELRGSDTGRAGSYSYYNGDGNKYLGASASTYGASFTSGDIIGISVGGGTIEFFKNNVSQGDAWTGLTGTFVPFISEVTCNITANFGQDSSFAGNKTAQGNSDDNGYGDFYYAPPTGFLALCTQNLPEPTVVPSEHFNTVIYTGNSSTQSITGVGFQPDMLWFKSRSATENHAVFDSVRPFQAALRPNSTIAEYSNTDTDDLDSVDSAGFTLNGNGGTLNTSGNTYVAWNWKANGTGVSNTNGTITSTVSANADAGFSIVSYTGTGSAATVGHGLSKAPELIIAKNRGHSADWAVGGNVIGSWSDKTLELNNTVATVTDSNIFGADPTTSLFTIGTSWKTNRSGYNHIAYCFHSVEGYSKVGSYTGNGSTDGTFVYTGFRPAYVM